MNRTATPPTWTRWAETTMKAIVQDRYGEPQTLRVADVPVPEIGPGDALVEVHAAGVDRGVWHLITGLPYLVRFSGFGLTRPKTPVPGLDVAGRVVAVGSDVTRLRVGDEVFGIARGSYAEFAPADAEKLALKPAGLSFESAAVAAISGSTALQALVDVARVKPGDSVLVIGASGGVGSYAVQLAKALGATVTGVAGSTKTDLVRSFGADQVIDYVTTDYLDGSLRYDVIIDTGGLNPVRKLRKALAPRGTLVIVGGEGGGRVTGGVGRQLRASIWSLILRQKMRTFISREHHSHLERLAIHIGNGTVVPPVGRRYPLENAADAVADLAAGRAAGKSVVVVRDARDAR